MTREEIMELDLEGIEVRKAEIREEVKAANDSAALDAIEAEKAIIEESRAAPCRDRKAQGRYGGSAEWRGKRNRKTYGGKKNHDEHGSKKEP